MLRAPTERVRRTSSCLSNPARARTDRPALGIGADSIARCRPLFPARTWTRSCRWCRACARSPRASATPPRATRTSSRSRPRRPSLPRPQGGEPRGAGERGGDQGGDRRGQGGARRRASPAAERPLREGAHPEGDPRQPGFPDPPSQTRRSACVPSTSSGAKPRRKHAKASTNTSSCSRDSATNSPSERRCASASVRSRCAKPRG